MRLAPWPHLYLKEIHLLGSNELIMLAFYMRRQPSYVTTELLLGIRYFLGKFMTLSRNVDLLTCLIPVFFQPLSLISGEESVLPDCPYSHGPHAVLGWHNGEGHERPDEREMKY